MSQPRNKY